MKYILSLISIIACLNVNAQNNAVKSSGKYQNDAERENLKGKVKSVTYYEYSLNKADKTLETEWNSKSVSNYNKAGNIEEFYLYKKSNQLAYHSVSIYDSKGRRIQRTGKDGKIASTSTYSYDSNQNLVETTGLGERSSFRIIYNKFGKRDTMYSNNSKTIYQYDEKGNCIKETRYKKDGSLDRAHIYIYDKHNNKIQDHSYDSTGAKTGKITYTYDNRRNPVLELDSNVKFFGGIPRKKLGNDTYLRTFKYEMFDKYGNWLKRSATTDDKPIHITKREITYY